MKKSVALLVPVFLFAFISTGSARDTMGKLPIKAALSSEQVQGAILNNVPVYWGDQSHPKIVKEIGEIKTSKRTSIGGKSDSEACDWALASAIKALQERALQEGANAIINVQSNIKNRSFASSTEYECLQGTMMVNVALKGTAVKIGK